MLARLFNLTLVAAIVACPLFCRSGSANGAGVVCRCHGHEHDQQSSNPFDHDSGTPHQCICSGAVLEDAAFDVAPDANWLAMPWAVEPIVFQVPFAQVTDFLTAPPPDGGANPGRALRCLYMSFLC